MRALVWSFMLCFCTLFGVAAPIQASPIDLDGNPSVKQLAGWIAEPGTASDLRAGCADRLVADVIDRRRGAIQAVVSLLSKDQPVHAKRAVLLAISRSERAGEVSLLAEATLVMRFSLPPELETVWVQTLGRLESEDIAKQLAGIAGDEQATLEQCRLAIRALSEHRRRFAAEALVDLIGMNRLPQVQAWACEALANLSHQDKLGQDRAAWVQWYKEVSDLNATQWQRMLHENLLSQVRQKQEVHNSVKDRLIQTQQALHRATPADQRQALLVDYLRNPLGATRLLAMDLIGQRLEDGGDFGVPLREQLRINLDDPLARVREASATLLGQLLDSEAADMIAKRLARGDEGDIAVERAYLVALTQLPRDQALAPGYAMLENPLLQAQAAGMLAASHRAEQGQEAYWKNVRNRVRELLEGVASPKPQMVTLLGLVIESDDDKSWQRIADWVDAEDDGVRAAAARVWAGSPHPLVILAKRSDDTVIRPIALRAIHERGGEVDTLKAIAERRPTEAEDVRLWEQAMVALAGRVDPKALMDVLNAITSPNGLTQQVRQRMLTAAIGDSLDEDPPSPNRLSLLLARAQVRVLADAPALVILDYEAALQHADQFNEAQRYNARKGLALAYFADSRIDDAVKLLDELLKPNGTLVEDANNSPLFAEFMEVAKAAIDQGRTTDAGKLLKGIRIIFGQGLSDANAERLNTLEDQIKAQAPPPATP